MANQAAKKVHGGVLWWREEDVLETLHALPVTDMWGVKRRAQTLQSEMGCTTIGDVARLPVGQLRAQFGVWGDVLHRWACGIDSSDLNPDTKSVPHQGYHQRTTLPREVRRRADVALVVLELLDGVCARALASHQVGRRVGLGLTYEHHQGGFYRAKTLPEMGNRSEQLLPTLDELLDRHWDGTPVRAVGVSLDLLQFEGALQPSLFEDRVKREVLWQTVDAVHSRFGATSLMRASSVTKAGQMRERTKTIGGHLA
jgi:DNA polymerase-4/DNA polymerase V